GVGWSGHRQPIVYYKVNDFKKQLKSGHFVMPSLRHAGGGDGNPSGTDLPTDQLRSFDADYQCKKNSIERSARNELPRRSRGRKRGHCDQLILFYPIMLYMLLQEEIASHTGDNGLLNFYFCLPLKYPGRGIVFGA